MNLQHFFADKVGVNRFSTIIRCTFNSTFKYKFHFTKSNALVFSSQCRLLVYARKHYKEYPKQQNIITSCM